LVDGHAHCFGDLVDRLALGEVGLVLVEAVGGGGGHDAASSIRVRTERACASAMSSAMSSGMDMGRWPISASNNSSSVMSLMPQPSPVVPARDGRGPRR